MLPDNTVPPGADWFVRKINDIERELAQINRRPQVLPPLPGWVNQSSVPSAPAVTVDRNGYPDGVSVWSVSGAPGNGWPTNGILVVYNYITIGRSYQQLVQASTGAVDAPPVYFRQWGTGSQWTAWNIQLATNPQPVGASSSTDQVDTDIPNGASYGAGSPVVGVTMTVPASGAFWINLDGYLECWADQNAIFLSYELRNGSTIGAGTVITSPHSDRSIAAGMAVNVGAPSLASSTKRVLAQSFTPGIDVNVRAMQIRTGSASGDVIRYRGIGLEPIP